MPTGVVLDIETDQLDASVVNCIVAKNIDTTYNWDTYWASGVSSGYGLRLNTKDAELSGRWGTVNSSIFTVTDNYTWVGTNNYIYYCFANAEGYIKVGSYEGNADNDGVFIYTGFRPAFILIKSVDASRHWGIHDNKRSPYNVSINQLDPDAGYAAYDSTGRARDFLSNGFKLRTSDADVNGSETYIYMAFAENPFKFAVAV